MKKYFLILLLISLSISCASQKQITYPTKNLENKNEIILSNSCEHFKINELEYPIHKDSTFNYEILEFWVRQSPKALEQIQEARESKKSFDSWTPILATLFAGPGIYYSEKNDLGFLKGALVVTSSSLAIGSPFLIYHFRSIQKKIKKTVEFYNNDLLNGSLLSENEKSMNIFFNAYFTGDSILQDICTENFSISDNISIEILKPLFKRTGTLKEQKLFKKLNPAHLNNLLEIASIIEEKKYHLTDLEISAINLKIEEICNSNLEALIPIDTNFLNTYYKKLIPIDSLLHLSSSAKNSKNIHISFRELLFRLSIIYNESIIKSSKISTDKIITDMEINKFLGIQSAFSSKVEFETKFINTTNILLVSYIDLLDKEIHDKEIKKRIWTGIDRMIYCKKQVYRYDSIGVLQIKINKYYQDLKKMLNEKISKEDDIEVKNHALKIIGKV